MSHLSSPGAWTSGFAGVWGLCWPALFAAVAGHPDAPRAPAIARHAEAMVLSALRDRSRDGGDRWAQAARDDPKAGNPANYDIIDWTTEPLA